MNTVGCEVFERLAARTDVEAAVERWAACYQLGGSQAKTPDSSSQTISSANLINMIESSPSRAMFGDDVSTGPTLCIARALIGRFHE
jgi:hypothetical protein